MVADHAEAPTESTPVLRIDSPEAREIADLSAVIQDLRFANGCCERLWRELQKESFERDTVLVRALWTATLVAYWRCFGKGKRAQLRRDDLKALPLEGTALEWHDYLCTLRSKHIAHSVNPYEQMATGVIPDANGLIEGVSTFIAVHITVEEDGVAATAAITLELVKLLNDRLAAKQDELTSQLRSQGPEAIADLLPLRVTIPGPEGGERARQ